MLIALPEIDGATNPTVFAGRHGAETCTGCARRCNGTSDVRAMAPCPERIGVLADKVARLAALRRSQVAERRVGIVLYGFPPNAGAVGTAAYLSVFESLHNTLHAMAAQGYDLTPPATVEELRAAVLQGNAAQYGQPANVMAHVTADDIVAKTPWLAEIEAVWGPAPGRAQSDGRGVFVLGARFGKVFVGVQPLFGYEGDPMRLLFERGFAPTHAFTTFYRWLREDFGADVLLHFGMHGALEFMPGKQAGMGPACWPDRLIGELAQHLPLRREQPVRGLAGQAPLERDHGHAPDAAAGAGRALQGPAGAEGQPEALARDEPGAPELAELEMLIAEQAAAVDLGGHAPDRLWLKLLETEDALIPDGLHVLGRPHRRCGDGGLPRHPRARRCRAARGLCHRTSPNRPRSRPCCAPLAAASSRRCRAAT